MAQQQREENSVLFSLKELRRLEDDRQRQEDEERRATVEAERRAREDAERRVREDAERRVRDEEARVRRVDEERVAREREEQLRLAEAERRARVEGEMRLQEQRMRLEVHAQKAKSPVKAIVGAIAVVLAMAGGMALKLSSDAKAAKQAALIAEQDRVNAEREKARVAEEAKQRVAAVQRQYDTLLKQMQDELSTARTKADRDAIQSKIDNLKKRGGKHPGGAPGTTATGAPAANPGAGIRIREISDDPTAGLPH